MSHAAQPHEHGGDGFGSDGFFVFNSLKQSYLAPGERDIPNIDGLSGHHNRV
ncbi:MAG TPA: hypothetical protein VNK82_11585 [Terriglobales bacterium]|nr:hypothetical protein [Terriglobales bacterium]